MEPATLNDADEVLALIIELSAWLKTLGIAQWSQNYPRALIKEDIRHDRVFVMREQGKLIATVTLSEKMDPYWADFPANAVYLHRLAIRRTHAARGMGSEILTWSEKWVANRGISLIRLDCHAENSRLRDYYTRHGYGFRGVRHYSPFRIDFALFEKNLA